jgi:hypothetical protein
MPATKFDSIDGRHMRHDVFQRWRSLRAGLLVASVTGILGALFTWWQIESDRRARAIAHVLSYTVDDALRGPAENVATRLMAEVARRGGWVIAVGDDAHPAHTQVSTPSDLCELLVNLGLALGRIMRQRGATDCLG